MNNHFRDNGGKLPAGLTPIINTTGKPIMIKPKKTWFDHMIDAFTAPFKPKPKREPIVKVRAEHISNSYGQLTRWKWECEICPSRNWHATYPAAIAQADRHARNHHRIQK